MIRVEDPSSAASGPSPTSQPRERWTTAAGPLDVDRAVVMGVVNLTPDSFSDGGRYRTVDEALDAARAMVEDGADLIDVGGESTRPGSIGVGPAEELRRVLPFIERAAGDLPVPVSVDTRRASVARAALDAGAAAINDVSGLAYDPELAGVVAARGAGVVLVHARGTPADMSRLARYDDVRPDVTRELEGALERADAAGIAPEAVVLDPGFGFAKSARQSLQLLAELSALRALGRPVLVGPSRKSFLGAVTGAPPAERLPETLAACVVAYFEGARIFRVHDVGPARRALAVAEAVADARVGAVRTGGGS